MRIAYVAQFSHDNHPGLTKKIVSQTTEWARQGHDVGVFQIARNPNEIREHVDISWHPISFRTKFGNLLHGRTIKKRLHEWSPDIIYHRQALYRPCFTSLSNIAPIVLEINTDWRSKADMMSWLEYFYRRATYHRVVKSAAGAVFLTSELGSRPEFQRSGFRTKVISDAIDLNEFPTTDAPNNETPRLVFLGTNRPWHGVDKILKLAEDKPDWTFDLIGPIERINYSKNITFHGMQTKDEYTPIISNADIAIGTLALHRIGMEMSSPLKVREYLAFGLPVIIGHSDPDFSDTDPFILRIPNEQDNIEKSMGEIEAFVNRWMGRRVPRESVHHISREVKERERINLFNDIISGSS